MLGRCATWHTSAPLIVVVAEREGVGHPGSMTDTSNQFEQAAQIVEAFAEGETDDHVLDLRSRIADAIRDCAIDD